MDAGSCAGWPDTGSAAESPARAHRLLGIVRERGVLRVGVARWRDSVYNGKTWTKPARVDKVRQWLTVSCATVTFCVADDADGDVATYNGTTWSGLRRVGIPVYLLSCPSRRFCTAPGPAGTVTFDGTTWTRTPAPHTGQLPSLAALSCTQAGFCAVVGYSDSSGERAAYTRNGSQWSRSVQVFAFDLPNDLVAALSCATPKFCVATNTFGLAAVGTGQ